MPQTFLRKPFLLATSRYRRSTACDALPSSSLQTFARQTRTYSSRHARASGQMQDSDPAKRTLK